MLHQVLFFEINLPDSVANVQGKFINNKSNLRRIEGLIYNVLKPASCRIFNRDAPEVLLNPLKTDYTKPYYILLYSDDTLPNGNRSCAG